MGSLHPSQGHKRPTVPTVPVSPVTQWKYLSDLELADTDYGIPAGVDFLLGGKVLKKQSSMAGGSVPIDNHQISRRAQAGY